MPKKFIFPTRYQSLTFSAPPIVVVPNFLSAEDCNRLRQQVDHDAGGEFLAGDTGIRVSVYAPVSEITERALILRMLNKVKSINRRSFRFADLFLNQTAHISRYGNENKDFRGWHVDLGSGGTRDRLNKLTAVVQLSPPSEYEGGELQFMSYHALEGKQREQAKQQGSLIVFPSYEFHQVVPVESGVRYSLIMFVAGKPFK